MKKTKVTRSLLAACSIVALTAVMYGCVHDGDDPPPDPTTVDSDGDSVTDANDAFPNDATETADADGDGVGDNADAFPNDAKETADSDGDGVGDNADAFPDDDTETADADGDGVGDNADLDDDNDGVADVHDQLPNDPTETVDSDGDGVGDNADLDDDNDGVLDADDWAPKDPMVQNPPAPTHEDVTMSVALGATEQGRLRAVLPDSGTSDTVTIPAGGTATRGLGLGVEFTCDSGYPCTITITNNLGTITASVSTQKLIDADDPTVTAGLPDPVDTFVNLNGGSTLAIRNLVTAQSGTETPPTLTATELIGMGIGGPGVTPEQAMLGLRGSLDPNSANTTGNAAGPGAVPTLAGGSTISDAEDGLDASMSDLAQPASDSNWKMKALFRDWGDTAGDTGDGGFETGAIIVNNLGKGTEHPFDRKLSGNYVNEAAQAMFALSIRADGTNPGVTTLGTSVYIGVDEYTPDGAQAALPLAASVQWANMEFDDGSLVPAQSQDLNVNATETFTGSYFGAPGQFQCIAAANTSCAIARGDDGIIRVNDTNAAPDIVASTGRWSFTPDPGAMITVPDQDWMAYGAWLTTPDDTAGTHRIGVFFNGMDPWTPAENALAADNAAGLRGSATYSGGATGIYVDGADSGLFTARAMLTATFDKDSTGTNVDADDYMISGRIDNFRGTDGVFLGDDTQASPNDPSAGENDWVVELGAFDFQTTTTGTIPATGTTGSADGVSWTGSWNGQFFGPSGGAPSGVAGRFWAETADADSVSQTDALPATSVVGAFGAEKD